jgi:hypothetical protein
VTAEPKDVTDVVLAARRGLRRDVALLVREIDGAELLIPLAQSVSGAAHGEERELTEDVTMEPHTLVDDDGRVFFTVFTRSDILEPVVDQLGWTTSGQPLEYATLPARVALDLGLQVMDDDQVAGLVLNPMHESELMLSRVELGSILNGKAVPLVGYVRHIPLQDFEETLVAEGADPPPEELVDAIEDCVKQMDELIAFELLSSFNADRDLEPHLTLNLRPARPDIDFEAVTHRLIERVRDLIPPPGYIDIVFDKRR